MPRRKTRAGKDTRRKDREILRSLAAQLAEIAHLPVHKEKARLWRKLNDLQHVRPLVWINEIPWNEMNVHGELTLKCAEPWARSQEWHLRATLYQWRHMPADMIVDDSLFSGHVINDSGIGLEVEARRVSGPAQGSADFVSVIKE
ncbi:MAG: hypothetical protein NTW87_31790, partial [Planctomycetota bacterium]|nr:hypothetical protein [Planctomycetota bacterium]